MEQALNHINDIIISFLSGDIDDKEKEELQKWISESPEHEKHFMLQQELWFSACNRRNLAKYDKDKAYMQFKQRIAEENEGNGVYKHSINRIWYYAASVVILFIVSYISYIGGQKNLKSEFADIVVEAPQGSRTRLSLPDGTRVWLNAGSKIAYSQGFGVDDRNVRLVGEGYFEVKKNKELPFYVHSGNLNVRVLGTKFDFRDYKDDSQAIVSLSEGKVALYSTDNKMGTYYLTPNQRAILEKGSGKITVESCTAATAKQWTNGNLILDGESLDDIVKKLERSYNVKISISDNRLYKYHFYGTFVRQEQSLHEVLDALSATGKIRYTVRGRSVTIY